VLLFVAAVVASDKGLVILWTFGNDKLLLNCAFVKQLTKGKIITRTKAQQICFSVPFRNSCAAAAVTSFSFSQTRFVDGGEKVLLFVSAAALAAKWRDLLEWKHCHLQ
jgi:hypothetical protein